MTLVSQVCVILLHNYLFRCTQTNAFLNILTTPSNNLSHCSRYHFLFKTHFFSNILISELNELDVNANIKGIFFPCTFVLNKGDTVVNITKNLFSITKSKVCLVLRHKTTIWKFEYTNKLLIMKKISI